jgi:hypothetical protein
MVKERSPDHCVYILQAMLKFAKRGFLVEESQYWLGVIELLLPFLSQIMPQEDSEFNAIAYDDVMTSIKLLAVKSYD